MTQSGIYLIRNTINGKIYVGSAVNIKDRWRVHKQALLACKHHSILLQRAWNKYGPEAFKFQILEPVSDPTNLLWREQFYLDYFRCYNPLKGYNISPTAGNVKGITPYTRTPEHVELMRRSTKGKSKTESHKRNLSLARMGTKPWNKGIPRTEEEKNKIRTNGSYKRNLFNLGQKFIWSGKN